MIVLLDRDTTEVDKMVILLDRYNRSRQSDYIIG